MVFVWKITRKLCINAFSLKEVSKKFLKFKRMLVIHSIE